MLQGGVAVLGTSAVFDTVQTHEQIFKLLYTTGYRLTGNHKQTTELIGVSVNAFNRQDCQVHNSFFKHFVRKKSPVNNTGVKNMLKILCTAYINKTAAGFGWSGLFTPGD
jgi:hypothetical protein